MSNQPGDIDDLPLVEKLAVEAPPSETIPVWSRNVPRPGPGFWEALLWCVLLLIVLYGGMIATAIGVFILEGIASGDIQTYLKQEQAGMDAVAKASQEGQHVSLPRGLADSLAWGMLFGQLGALMFALILIRAKIGASWKRQLAIRRPPVGLLVLALLATPGLMVLHGGFHELIHAAFGQKMTDDTSLLLRDMFSGWPAAFAVLVIGVCPGLLEELFCRGFLGRGLLARYGWVGGVILTATMFGFLHIMPLYALGTIFMGLALHFTYIVSRSLWVPILIHGSNNAVTVLASIGTIQLAAADQDAAALGVWIYIAATISVVFLLLALWTGRVRLQATDPEQPIWSLPYASVAVPTSEDNGALMTGRPNLWAVLIGVVATGCLLWAVLV